MTEQFAASENETKGIYLPDNVSLTILFSDHVRRSDLGDFDEFVSQVRGADIYLKEAYLWTEMGLAIDNEIASGNRGYYERAQFVLSGKPMGEFKQAVNDALFDSHVKVVFPDIPFEIADSQELIKAREIDGIDLFSDTYEHALEVMRNHFIVTKSVLSKRDWYILRNLGDLLSRTIDNDPDLKEKEIVRVFMTIGAHHKTVADVLTQVSEKIRIKNNTTLPEVTIKTGAVAEDNYTLVINNIESGGDDSEPLGRTITELFIRDELNKLGINISDLDLRKSMKLLTREDTEMVFYYLKAIFSGKIDEAKKLEKYYHEIISKLTSGISENF